MNPADRCPDYASLLQQLIERTDAGSGPHCANCAVKLKEMRLLISSLLSIGVELTPSPAERDEGLIDQIIGTARTAQNAAPDAQRALALAAAARKEFNRDWLRARDLAIAAREIALKLIANATPAGRALTRMARAETAAVLGNCLIRLDHLDEGETLIREAIEEFEESGDLLASGRARINLSTALIMKKAPGEAVVCASSAADDLESIGELLWAARAKHCVAVALHDLQRYDEAEKYFNAAQAVYGREELYEEQAMVLVTLGKIAIEKGHAAAALDQAQTAEVLLHRAGNKADAARSRWLAGSARLALGEQTAGMKDLDDAAMRLLALSLWIEPALIRCEQATALLNAGEIRTARTRILEIASLCPADEGNEWVRLAVQAHEQDRDSPSADQLRGVIQLLSDRLSSPEAVTEQGVLH